MATLVCAHGTANLTNRGASEFVEERIFYALKTLGTLQVVNGLGWGGGGVGELKTTWDKANVILTQQ